MKKKGTVTQHGTWDKVLNTWGDCDGWLSQVLKIMKWPGTDLNYTNMRCCLHAKDQRSPKIGSAVLHRPKQLPAKLWADLAHVLGKPHCYTHTLLYTEVVDSNSYGKVLKYVEHRRDWRGGVSESRRVDKHFSRSQIDMRRLCTPPRREVFIIVHDLSRGHD